MKTGWDKAQNETAYIGKGDFDGARIYKQGKVFVLDYHGLIYEMPKRGSFDHAEALMAQLV